MDTLQIDSFLEYITIVEEGSEQFSQEQVKKLELIRTKVGEIVKRTIAPTPPPISKVQSQIPQNQPQHMVVTEKLIQSFTEYVKTDK